MYEIDVLLDLNWKCILESDDIKEIDKIAFKLCRLQMPCRILLEEKILIFLNGSRYEYDYWKNNYVRKPKVLERKKNEFRQ